MASSQSQFGIFIGSTLVLSTIATSAFGMTTFDRTQTSSLRELSDAQTSASVDSMNRRIARGIARTESITDARLVSQPTPKISENVRPQWSGQSCATLTENGSYLARFEPRHVDTLNDRIFDVETSKQYRTEYESRVLAEDARDHAGLTENSELRGRFEAMKSFARRAVSTFSKIRFKAETQHLKEVAEAQAGLREPIAAAALAASLYTGRAVSFRVTDGIRVSSMAAIKSRAASVSMQLPNTGFSSTVAYSRDSAFNAQLAKSITPSVSAVVGSGSGEKGSAQIVYSVSF